MEILNLATQEKQDEILSNFPISGGTDFGEYRSMVTSNARDDTVLDIEGEGMLIHMVGLGGTADVHLEVDGEVILPWERIGTSQIIPFLVFKNSLVLKTNSNAFVRGTALLK